MQWSTGVVAGSCPTALHTSGGMYDGGNGITCGPVTGARYATGEQERSDAGSHWVLDSVAARACLNKTDNQPWGVLQDKRTVRIMSAVDTARRGENYAGS
jgi:hypothetical protein